MNKYTCHVCGYPNLDEPPRGIDGKIPSFDICDCCGVEFGYEDTSEANIIRYRQKWIEAGGEWFCKEMKPADWDMKKQLKNIGVDIID
ncbi:hypothetical protein [Clostridium cibarium]|uniref:Transcription factor zinc-finger domain-containing protein n=1 Tax=Clostridium cibarium TaxID=2762247 RepID=A0ABR8PWF8_9CLOT|nr:hypothetical protein [Clostridium cibarium]MBD7912472.1 hypothetical protein [Clostridium cibarium]